MSYIPLDTISIYTHTTCKCKKLPLHDLIDAVVGALNQCVLSRKDSNLDKQNQNLLCYHYTTRQNREQLLSNCERKGSN